jgi:uncharacterized protein
VKSPLSSFAVLLLAGVLGVISGCGSSPIARFYTLKPDAAPASAEDAVALRVVVNPVTIPDLVDRPQIVTRGAGNQVQLDEFARWGEPLKGDIARVIAANLGALLGSERVSVFDSGSDVPPVWRVRVDVMRFDSMPGDAVTVDAQWTVWPPKKTTPVLGHSLEHEPVQGQGYDAVVAAHDRALAAVSRDIASAIRTSQAQ